MADFINVIEVFYSFQGESTLVGRPTIFIRTARCNLSCITCDTKYSLKNGSRIKIKDLLRAIEPFKTEFVCITGGEPLLQRTSVKRLIKQLLRINKKISIETNGAVPIKGLDKKVKKIVDVKTPSSKQVNSFLLENLKHLNKNDEIKFLVSNRRDFDFYMDFIARHRIKNSVLLSPNLAVKGLANKLASWILKEKVKAIFQPQLHKLVKEKPVYILKYRT